MPHDSSKIYTQGENGVSTDDVASVLGVTSHDVGTLCTCSAINMWSKYKPFKLSMISLTEEQLSQKLKEATYGLDKPTYSNARNVIANWTDGLNGWLYLRPTGGANEPYRLGDFRNYYHGAEPPITDTECTEKVTAASTDKVQVNFDVNSYDLQIGLTDLGVENWYMGVVATKEGINDVYVFTDTKALSSVGDNGHFEIDVNLLAAGSWIFYPVFVDKVITTEQKSCNLIPIPCAEKVRCLVVEQAVDKRYGFVNAVWKNTSHNQIECYAELWNDMTSQQTFTNVKIVVIKGDPEGSYETVTNKVMDNATVTASSRYYYTSVQIDITYDATKTYWVGITFDATPSPNPNWSQIEEQAPE